MLTITVEFIHGSYRATDFEDTTFTRRPKSTGEWPPSPARLLAALMAADGTGPRQRVTTNIDDLRALENAEPPRIYADDPRDTSSSLRHERFVVVDETANNAVQNYPGRNSQPVWPGVTTTMAHPMVVFEWPSVMLGDDEYQALRLRCARVGYLGCSDSPVRVTADTSCPSELPPAWHPDPKGRDFIGVPSPGLIDSFDEMFERFSNGHPVRRAWIPTTLAPYRAPHTSPIHDVSQPSCIWLRFARPINGRRVLTVATTLKAAVLTHLENALGSRDAVPAVIHGHHDGEVARWLPLPMVGTKFADGRIRGACIWLPPETESWVIAEATDAAAQIDRLVAPGIFDVPVSLFDGTERPLTSNPRTWVRPSRGFVTAFPAVYERRVKGELSLDHVSMWCRHAGLPDPVAFRSAQVPLIPGAVDLTPTEAFRRRDQHRPYRHIEILFTDPLEGPAAIGRGRQYGLGLLWPTGRSV